MPEIKRDFCKPGVDRFHSRSCPLFSRLSCELYPRFRSKTGSVVTDTDVIVEWTPKNSSEMASVKGFYCFQWFSRSRWIPEKISINRTQGRGLICIFSRWPPVKPSTYYYVLMV